MIEKGERGRFWSSSHGAFRVGVSCVNRTFSVIRGIPYRLLLDYSTYVVSPVLYLSSKQKTCVQNQDQGWFCRWFCRMKGVILIPNETGRINAEPTECSKGLLLSYHSFNDSIAASSVVGQYGVIYYDLMRDRLPAAFVFKYITIHIWGK